MDLCWSSALMEVEKSADEKDPNKTNLIGQAIVRETARAEADDESLGMRDGGQEDSLGQVMSGSLAHQADKVGSIKEHGPSNSEYEVGPHTDGSAGEYDRNNGHSPLGPPKNSKAYSTDCLFPNGGSEELQALESPGNQPKEAMERNRDGTRGLRP
ncbi:hypothetical protein Ancab_025664 [Ancistrocladus abbreviatus]